ncbi:hypothetical protein ACFY1V_31845 [Streptomyces sp. NPDC001255]|uniref:hypothetical protein n=1 Tax=Streptomyces sp. NPDC001255 TaxID=3364550 RepID=UPI0036B13A39
MIRHDRAHLLPLTERQVAARMGVPWNTWIKSPPARERFRAAVPTLTDPETRTCLYDPEQVAAAAAGTPVPVLAVRDGALPDADRHPDDLLDDHEAAAARGCTPATLRTAAKRGFLTGSVTVSGVRWWPRHAITPKRAGRTVGSRDSAPRAGGLRERAAARVAEIAAEIRAGTPLAAEGIVARYGVSTRTAERYLRDAQHLTE